MCNIEMLKQKMLISKLSTKLLPVPLIWCCKKLAMRSRCGLMTVG